MAIPSVLDMIGKDNLMYILRMTEVADYGFIHCSDESVAGYCAIRFRHAGLLSAYSRIGVLLELGEACAESILSALVRTTDEDALREYISALAMDANMWAAIDSAAATIEPENMMRILQATTDTGGSISSLSLPSITQGLAQMHPDFAASMTDALCAIGVVPLIVREMAMTCCSAQSYPRSAGVNALVDELKRRAHYHETADSNIMAASIGVFGAEFIKEKWNMSDAKILDCMNCGSLPSINNYLLMGTLPETVELMCKLSADTKSIFAKWDTAAPWREELISKIEGQCNI